MAYYLRNILGGGDKSTTAGSVPSGDADFADAPSPTPVPFSAVPGGASLTGSFPASTGVPYTKWYNVHERHSLSEFRAEGIILAVISVIFALHFIGARLNRGKARAWIKAHAPVLSSEFAQVGIDGLSDRELQQPEKALKEKSLFEFATYATGRQNVAFMDAKVTLKKRFNPIMSLMDTTLGFLFESFGQPEDGVEAIMYPFDGKEALTVPQLPGGMELRSKDSKSAYDNFVWAVVNKDRMKQVRDDRYDVSITFTKDNSKLPVWTTVMSESAEITNTLLTDELAAAVKEAGDLFDYLIISDQPEDKPKTLDEATPRKRIFLKYRLPSSNDYSTLVPLFSYFLRIPDQLVASAKFRPEVMRKVNTVREDLIKQIKKAAEDEKAEERALERDKARKAKRDAELKSLDAKAQKKFLEKEREKEMRKASKGRTVRA